jgi:phosphate transport system permease protein
MLTGVTIYKAFDHGGLFLYSLNEQCMALSMHLYYIATQASGAPRELPYAIAVVLVGLVLLVNVTAIALRVWLRARKKW